MEPKLFVATKALIVKDNRILVLREAGSYVEGTNVGRFDVPGGRLKNGEHFRDALKREVFEETGLDVEIGDVIAVNEWRPIVRGEPWQIVGMFFICMPKSDTVKLSEDHDAYEWLDPSKHESSGIIENLKPVFETFLRRIKS